MKYKAVAFYSDGRSADATDGLIGENARGIQAILQENKYVGVEIVTGCDYYLQDKNGIWFGCNIFGLFNAMLDNPQFAMGTMMATSDEYDEIMTLVNTEKNGWLAKEKRPDIG